jgi:hypothetical protein
MRATAWADETASNDSACPRRNSRMRGRRYAAGITGVRRCYAMAVVNASHRADARRVAIMMATMTQAIMRTSDAAPVAMVESPFETIVMAKRMASVMRMPEDARSGSCERANRKARRKVTSMRSLSRNASDGSASNCGDHLEQVTRLRIAMQGARHFADSLG